MNILIIGGGGREHALGWKLRKSPKVRKIFFSPGNGGTLAIGENIVLDNSNSKAVVSFVQQNNIGLVVIGPDNYLVMGLADKLQKADIAVFGPSKKASKLEWSKSFAKEFMMANNIPTARFKTFSELKKAAAYVKKKT